MRGRSDAVKGQPVDTIMIFTRYLLILKAIFQSNGLTFSKNPGLLFNRVSYYFSVTTVIMRYKNIHTGY